jgi:hypothetical protein
MIRNLNLLITPPLKELSLLVLGISEWPYSFDSLYGFSNLFGFEMDQILDENFIVCLDSLLLEIVKRLLFLLFFLNIALQLTKLSFILLFYYI